VSTKKRLYSEDYVKRLEEEVSTLSKNPQAHISGPSPPLAQGSPTRAVKIPKITANPKQSLANPEDPSEQEVAIDQDPLISSSLNFGLQITSLPAKSPSSVAQSPKREKELDNPVDDVYGVAALPELAEQRAIDWPSLEGAHELLDRVLRALGQLQHLFEPRSFSDKLSNAFETQPPTVDRNDCWYLEMLMVLAIGELLGGTLQQGEHLPGSSYYLEALKNLPSFVALRSTGMTAIEVLGLMAFYQQCADRRNDAYLSVGTS
jgi:proline utilization trans-activator